VKRLSLSYEEWVRGELSEGDAILDAGCGGGEFGVIKEVLERSPCLVGIDIDRDSVRGNDKYDHLICGNVEWLPVGAGRFDLIVSRFVFEHLQDPELAFREMARVLRPGGAIIILTQNIWNPLMFLSSILPLGVRRAITRMLFRSEEDEGRYETFYRCNSRRRFAALAEGTPGMRMEIFQRYNATTLHLWKNPLLKGVFTVVERFLDLGIFSLFRTSLIVKFRK
jgi:ubiquinone/menaquinone biosynthesis C-methylase UbiE